MIDYPQDEGRLVVVHETPATIDIREIQGGPQDGAEVVTMNWGGREIVARTDAAVDTASGILFLADKAQPSYALPPAGDMALTTAIVTVLTVYAFLLWQGLELLMAKLF